MSNNTNKENTTSSPVKQETAVVASTVTTPVADQVKPVTSTLPGLVSSKQKEVEKKPEEKPVAKPKVNYNVEKLKVLIKDYEDAVAKQNMSKEVIYESIGVMISICNYLSKNNDPQVFEYFFRYFQKHQDDIMYHETALHGIHTIRNKNTKTRVSATHACYLELCRVRALKNGSFGFTVRSMQMMNISELQAKWIVNKSTNRG